MKSASTCDKKPKPPYLRCMIRENKFIVRSAAGESATLQSVKFSAGGTPGQTYGHQIWFANSRHDITFTPARS